MARVTRSLGGGGPRPSERWDAGAVLSALSVLSLAPKDSPVPASCAAPTPWQPWMQGRAWLFPGYLHQSHPGTLGTSSEVRVSGLWAQQD